jgi:CDP-4-dehydro-6-deoxyglucose reductase, E1
VLGTLTKGFSWPLMAEGISAADRVALADFLTVNDRLTMGQKVREFEAAWSAWQGCRYSVMVNSGSSANLLLVDAARELYGTGPVVCQSVTWATNISPIVQFGMPLHLVDVDLRNFGPDLADLEAIFQQHKIRYLFLTHLLGFPALSRDLLDLCSHFGVDLLEDCCESHGATYADRKVGNFGLGSTFSFYYGHHMTTIEGGMVCTDRPDVYRALLLLRSHGMLRELPDATALPDLDPRFTFLMHGFNLRPTEISGVLGLLQLQRLDDSIQIRNANLLSWLRGLNGADFYVDFNTSGVSSFSLPLILTPQSRWDIRALQAALASKGVEHRPFVSGNLCKHPFLAGHACCRALPVADYVHQRGMYVGNHQHLSLEMIDELVGFLNAGSN